MLQEIDAFTIVIIGSGLIFLVVAIFFIVYYKYANRLMSASVKNNKLIIEHQKELLKNEIKAIDKERERLARDLHDEIGALLSYISMNLSSIQELQTIEKVKSSINESKKNLDDSIQKVRQISHSLLPPTLDLFGLKAAIEEFINSLSSEIIIDFRSLLNLEDIPKSKTLHLYRLIMEFTNNSIKHAKCSQINIHFSEAASQFKVILSDNGKGFDYETAIKKGGMGLKNMESRLNSLEAKYNIYSNNQGTRIEIYLQKENKNEKG